jgi:hypothetical protein
MDRGGYVSLTGHPSPALRKSDAPAPSRAAHLDLVIPSAEFFALVDRHLTQPMASAGYAKIGDYEEVTDSSRLTPLQASRRTGPAFQRWYQRFVLPRLHTRRSQGRMEQVLTVGYEGEGEDDEKWLRFYPDTSELDVQDWREALSEYADWDVTNNLRVSTAGELEHRLHALGLAIAPAPSC